MRNLEKSSRDDVRGSVKRQISHMTMAIALEAGKTLAHRHTSRLPLNILLSLLHNSRCDVCSHQDYHGRQICQRAQIRCLLLCDINVDYKREVSGLNLHCPNDVHHEVI